MVVDSEKNVVGVLTDRDASFARYSYLFVSTVMGNFVNCYPRARENKSDRLRI